ncbi:protein bride of sevenless-like [Anopheles albimanus]|uniref:G_PROTEIN_RECEP_F3_4 domain-containing protein n=1 Tax=Anopheles albimanus TaxID=7167 RepID=A0A182FPF9_ANOAL|nr:protein bride of sevenless-like [Anopheles albimanus]XP_035776835.1 protein bride of sevenless-like [Anopheles albimanus]XP_035776836.1 protein bride of sevenless-like [Anopheles albimanus]XP_035776837.1 protein bride of sevenless-like [Anopheles albimanus]XP_035776838.1 protein bride of sevenless-like [Anopheles albimanus]XP_035776839.1 protein bride of sevenless-like [Anopheles albimanus]XP_035776840.1 protein bride of sevenless-like [Anopheles albimanus]
MVLRMMQQMMRAMMFGKRGSPSVPSVACLIAALLLILCCFTVNAQPNGRPKPIATALPTLSTSQSRTTTSSSTITVLSQEVPDAGTVVISGVLDSSPSSTTPKTDSSEADGVQRTVDRQRMSRETTAPSASDSHSHEGTSEVDGRQQQQQQQQQQGRSVPIEARSIADATAVNGLSQSMESSQDSNDDDDGVDEDEASELIVTTPSPADTVSTSPSPWSTESEPSGTACPERPFVDMTGDYQHRKYQQIGEVTQAAAAPRSGDYRQSARDGAGQRQPEGVNDGGEGFDADHGYRLYRLPGDLMLTFIVDTDEFGATLLAIDRINELRLAGADISLGLTIIQLLNTSLIQRVLQQEVNYLKECSTNTIGIFVDASLWPAVRLLSETLDYNIFPLPSTHDLLFTKTAHLLYELPWTNANSSAMVRSGSSELVTRFGAICRHEHLCLESFPSSDMIYILLGLEPTISLATNGTLVLVLTEKDHLYESDLPDRAYVIAETELNVSTLGFSWERYGATLRGLDLLVDGSLLLEVADLLNRTGIACQNTSIECMNNWKYHAKRPHTTVLEQLRLMSATQYMVVELKQKVITLPAANATRSSQMKLIASSNVITNYTTVRERSPEVAPDAPAKLGAIFYCAKEFEIRHPDFIDRQPRPPYYDGHGIADGAEMFGEMSWQLKMEAWVAAGLTVSSLGILLCAAILIFLIVRVCMDDILEGHPLGSILLLISLIVQFAAFIPFSLEYTSYPATELSGHRVDTMHTWNALCTVKIFLVSMCYCMTFSLLLCRAIMLASIGSEGGFLSHINGYIQSVICGFSTLVQFGLSVQLVIVLQANAHNISCSEIYYGHWFWAVIAYDGILLVALIFLAPFIFRSQRNYREGLLLVTGSVLCLVIWTVWIPLCMFGYEWREAAVSLGMVATALAVLVGIMIPRCFLIVRGIARSDLVQALPSLTSLAFAQANQYISEQSVYECVNPAMRQRSPTDDSFIMDQDLDEAYGGNSEIPTLPLRGQRGRLRQENGASTINNCGNSHVQTTMGNGLMQQNSSTNVTHIAPNFYGISNPYSCSDSLTSISPNKITRF